ncbi:MAG: polyphosphate kinase 1 [Oscillospiraceae bacterium]|nr:polyphosphate kinase 1 [Oscillospiraceae bacterium]
MGKKKFSYANRELSWLAFNSRVLEEAMEKKYPVIERAKFLGITASNLDEFFMVRISGVREKMEKKPKRRDFSGLKPKKLYEVLTEHLNKFSKKQYKCMKDSIIPSLENEKINFLKWKELNENQKSFVQGCFERSILPIITPMAIDPGRPFPFLTGRGLNIAVEMKNSNDKTLFGIVQVPSVLPRYIEIPVTQNLSKNFIMLEDVMVGMISNIFQLHQVKSTRIFRITRNTDSEINEEAESILAEIKKNIKKRKRGDVVRLELAEDGSSKIKKFLIKSLEVSKDEIYKVKGPIDLTFWLKFSQEDWPENMRFKKQIPATPAPDFYGHQDVFEAIRSGDKMVCNPFESFQEVIDFVKQASEDENVLAIKQVLYRVSSNSPIVDALIRASENGKEVTAFVELKARFDEENNILWAQKLEKSGCHVVYGLPGLKTHCKVTLVVRKEGASMRLYAHLGTGNYNDLTAKFYTDIGMFTCKNKICMDVSSLFNMLTGYATNLNYQKLIVSPNGTRFFFEKMIKNEIKNAKAGLPSKIIFKVNSVVDKKIINLLYNASNAGVKIRMIVRGVSCLIPGVKKMSENIRVISIVGKLLEHSRIFYFENGGIPKIYMGSADLMRRNLDRRIEVIFPVEDEKLKNRAVNMLKVMLADNINAREENSDGKYDRVTRKGKVVNSQQEFFDTAHKSLEEKQNKQGKLLVSARA